MDNNALSRLLKLRRWINGHKSITAAILAVIMAGGTFGGAMAFEHNQNVNIGASTASVAVSQSVFFNGTNANLNPITYDGVNYTSTSPLYTQIGQTYYSHGLQKVSASFSFGGFEPGDYIQMTVNLTNTGHTIMLLNSSGVYVNISAGITLQNGSSLISETVQYPLATVFSPPANNASIIMGYLTSSQSSGLTDNYGQILPDNELWIAGFSSVNNTPIPQYLNPGQTFAYTVWVGLGTNTANLYGSTSSLEISVPMIPAR